MNVFFQDIYLEAFTLEKMEHKYLNYSEFKMEGDMMRSVIAQLNDVYSTHFCKNDMMTIEA